VPTTEYKRFIERLDAYLALNQTSHVLDMLLERMQQRLAVRMGRHAEDLSVEGVISLGAIDQFGAEWNVMVNERIALSNWVVRRMMLDRYSVDVISIMGTDVIRKRAPACLLQVCCC
jgi:hypothetical protein